jgi:hypothetical protein
VSEPNLPAGLLRDHVLDAELGALLWLLLDARTPLVVVGERGTAREALLDGLAGMLPPGARRVDVLADDDFEWLPEAVELGWRRERVGPRGADQPRLSASDGILVVRGLADPDGVTGARARIVVRALALGYGLLATMRGGGLDDALAALHDPVVGTDEDERSRLGVVVAVGGVDGVSRITAAHYVRPVALDTHGHVQRPTPAVLATWNERAGRFDHFAWGLAAELAGRLALRPIELEREQARRAARLMEAAAGGATGR